MKNEHEHEHEHIFSLEFQKYYMSLVSKYGIEACGLYFADKDLKTLEKDWGFKQEKHFDIPKNV